MLQARKILTLLLMLCLLASVAACTTGQTGGQSQATEATDPSAEAPTEPAGQESSQPLVVVDAAGREVTVPENIERIVITCRGGTTNEVAIFADPNMIFGQPTQKAYPQLLKMFPYFETVTDPGSFDDVSVEQVLALQPDIVFVGVSSKKGNALLEEAGLVTYTMQIGWATAETLKEEFLNMGKILKNEELAEKLVAYWDEKINLVKELVAAVPEEQRKVVYYTSKTITDANVGNWGQSWIKTSGGKPVIEGQFNGDISVEQVMEWNPDVILTHAGSGIDAIMSDERIQDLQAVKDKAVYQAPTGAFWWDRPSPESPLSFLWLAKTLYPEATAEIDLKAETVEFFKIFYGYDLSDAEYESFFATGK
ncbi:MAG: ABC transporter substrate-binding protein [Clostridiales bacterium]